MAGYDDFRDDKGGNAGPFILTQIFRGEKGQTKVYTPEQLTHGRKFSNRLLANISARYSPTEIRALMQIAQEGGVSFLVPIAFPEDVESIECFAVDLTDTDNHKFHFGVCSKTLLGASQRYKNGLPEEFVATLTESELAVILLVYDPRSPLYGQLCEGYMDGRSLISRLIENPSRTFQTPRPDTNSPKAG